MVYYRVGRNNKCHAEGIAKLKMKSERIIMKFIVLLLPFVVSCTCMSQKLPEVDHIVRYDGTNGDAYEIAELDIKNAEIIYIPMHNRSWSTEFDELLSREPTERGKLVILIRKSCVFNPVLPNQKGRSGIGNIDENQKNLWCGYLKSENGKELYIANFFMDEFGDIISADGGFYIDMEVQKPDNIKIKFYNELQETPIPSFMRQIREKNQSDSKSAWTRIEASPTKLRHLTGIKTEEEKAIEFANTSVRSAESIVLTDEEIHEQERLFWKNGGVSEYTLQLKRVFEASVEEHNQKVEMIRSSENLQM